MPSSIVYCIKQDTRGYLWFGTRYGLCRYNGVEFQKFFTRDGLADNRIFTIFIDRADNIWIGTDKGVSSFRECTGFKSYDGLSGSSVYAVYQEPDGKMWFGTSRGLTCYDGKNFRHYTSADGLHSEMVFNFAPGEKGGFRFGTRQGLGCFKDGNFSQLNRLNERSEKIIGVNLQNQTISSLFQDSQGDLWIGTIKGLFRSFRGRLMLYSAKNGLCHDSVTSIVKNSDGKTWIGTWNGVSLLSGDTITNFSTKNGLADNFVYCVLQDREGNMWFGTHGGISCLPPGSIETFTIQDGLPNNMILDMVQDRENKYWFGTSEGLSCYAGNEFKNYSTEDGLPSNIINNLMCDSRNRIWISTPQGLSIFSEGKFANYTVDNGLTSNILFEIIENRDGTVRIATGRGITLFRAGTFKPSPFNKNLSSVFCLLEDREGNTWFSSMNNLYMDSNNSYKNFTNHSGLSDRIIKSLFQDKNGRIWIASEGGLSCYRNGTFTLYTAEEGHLPDNTCHTVTEDNRGRIWIGTAKGITRFDGTRFKIYRSQRLGLTHRSWLSAIKDRKGKLWFGTNEGVTGFYPPPVTKNSIPPPVYITELKVMEKKIPLIGNGSFEHNENIFRFNFVGISFINGGIRFEYKMEPIDERWQTTGDRSLFYPFLPPGSYKLRIKAINSDGIQSENDAVYSFDIHPPFWSTGWFRASIALLLSSLLVLAIRWRIRRVKEKEEARSREAELELKNRQLVLSQRMELMGALATGTVHDLKNLMAVIIGYSRAIGRKRKDSPEDHAEIEVIKKTAGTAVQMAKQILSFSRPKHHKENIRVELRRELGEIVETLKVTQPKNVKILWQLSPEPVYFPIHPARFQQLVMNLCLNGFDAMPYGGNIKISLIVSKDNDIVLEIADSGQSGIPEDQLDKIFDPLFTTKKRGKGTGLGLFVVRQIVEEYGGNIVVHSKPGSGTTFTVRLPRQR